MEAPKPKERRPYRGHLSLSLLNTRNIYCFITFRVSTRPVSKSRTRTK